MSIAALVILCGCQITVDPVFDDYYGFRATMTVSPNILPEPSHDISSDTVNTLFTCEVPEPSAAR